MKKFHLISLLITLILNLHNAYSIDYYCKKPNTIGRVNYVCDTYKHLNTSPLSIGLATLHSINGNAIFKDCKKECKDTCKKEKTEQNPEPASCSGSCVTNCFSQKIQSVLSPVEEALKAFDAECGKSLHDSQVCEKKEAKQYCKSTYTNPVKRLLPPKNLIEFKNLKQAYLNFFAVYSKRFKNLQEEMKNTSEQVRKGINDVLDCKVLKEKIYICMMDTVSINPTTKITDYITSLANQYRQDGTYQAANCKNDKPTPTPQPTPTATATPNVEPKIQGCLIYQDGISEHIEDPNKRCPLYHPSTGNPLTGYISNRTFCCADYSNNNKTFTYCCAYYPYAPEIK